MSRRWDGDTRSATYVRQRRASIDGSGTVLQFEVGTGEIAPDAAFDPHGHVVVISVDGAVGSESR